MLLTLSDDVRVILIKLSDRLHNMNIGIYADSQKIKNFFRNTLFIRTFKAYRLGLYPIKTELEDLGLKHTNPEEYKDISQKLKETKEERSKYIRKFIRPIRSVLKEKEFSFKIKGRPKSIFSIRKK